MVVKLIFTDNYNYHFLDLKTVLITSNSLFNNLYTLLMLLYRRDCRRSYTPPGHWLIKEIKVSAFISELEKNRRAHQLLLQTMPHIIPHEDRVRLFRKHIISEKTALGLTESSCASPQSTLITIHRLVFSYMGDSLKKKRKFMLTLWLPYSRYSIYLSLYL